jgi:peptide chain release factor 2
MLKLKDEMSDISFWNNRDNANEIIKEHNNLKDIVDAMEASKNDIDNNLETVKSLLNDHDEELRLLIEQEIPVIEDKLAKLEVKLLLDEPYDKNNAILEIHAGAGGTEACDWASMLHRMYIRWCERNNYKIEEIDYQSGDEVGIKSVAILVKGTYAYGYLKGEKGVHRLVRISPFDANKKRHTSFASIDVTPEFNDDIDVEIKEEDLKVDVYRSGGCGGQGVNTTDSAVRITHLPTKIVVTCQNERSQIKNKDMAIKILKNKLYKIELDKRQKEVSDIKGIHSKIEFGSQIRSYIMQPYAMVKDHRTDYETGNVEKVMDGYIDEFIEAYLKRG